VFWTEGWGRGEELAGAYVGDARGPDQAGRLGESGRKREEGRDIPGGIGARLPGRLLGARGGHGGR